MHTYDISILALTKKYPWTVYRSSDNSCACANDKTWNSSWSKDNQCNINKDTICQTRLNDIVNRAKYLSILYWYLEDPDKYESDYNSLNNKNNWLSKIIYNEWGWSIQYVDNWCIAMQSSFTTISIQDVCGNMYQEVLNTEKKVDSLCYRN